LLRQELVVVEVLYNDFISWLTSNTLWVVFIHVDSELTISAFGDVTDLTVAGSIQIVGGHRVITFHAFSCYRISLCAVVWKNVYTLFVNKVSGVTDKWVLAFCTNDRDKWVNENTLETSSEIFPTKRARNTS